MYFNVFYHAYFFPCFLLLWYPYISLHSSKVFNLMSRLTSWKSGIASYTEISILGFPVYGMEVTHSSWVSWSESYTECKLLPCFWHLSLDLVAFLVVVYEALSSSRHATCLTESLRSVLSMGSGIAQLLHYELVTYHLSSNQVSIPSSPVHGLANFHLCAFTERW